MNQLNVFSGPHALNDFLNPEKHLPIPLVELPESCNPFYAKRVRIFAKLLNMLPLANVKSVPAFGMLKSAQKKGKLTNVNSLVEASSGNTVFSLAAIGRSFGVPRTTAIVSQEVTKGKLQMLQLMGIGIRVVDESICPDPNDPQSSIYQAHNQANEAGWFNPGQFDNGDNPLSHEEWTGPQIFEQTNGEITLFCAGLGTAGTAAGVGKFLKKKNPLIQTIGAVRAPNNPVPGTRTLNQVNAVGFDWQSHVDQLVEVGTLDSFRSSLKLIQQGLLVGPSSGFSFAGLMQKLSEYEKLNQLDDLRNENGEVVAVFICCDSPFPYLNEYFKLLPPESFSMIENDELLLYNKKSEGTSEIISKNIPEISPRELLELGFGMTVNQLNELVQQNLPIASKRNTIIVDIRHEREFKEFSLPASINIPADELLFHVDDYSMKWSSARIIVVCPYGGKSSAIVHELRTRGVDACHLKGGLIEWSRQHYPRLKDQSCTVPRSHTESLSTL
ncbi:MAG: pyridoxal-phosphate dependent enzyme [Candidatus Diapherotrites archaeon]|uniref:Pyridoxal-phosphate dependent enzyme n=1 Tax=Candidatus Iainarchaeum sp. TaxID=3101447 RepID=A0A8T4CAR9_9ARCH|nr:pyridoxal-phosphate dependent enzyme [Candidatus Diapherotrites archaeon]